MIATEDASVWYGGRTYELVHGQRPKVPDGLMAKLERMGLIREEPKRKRKVAEDD